MLLFSCSVMSTHLQHRRLQHVRLPCRSPSSRACSNSCPLSQCCHPTILSSVVPFSPCLQSFPASGSFLMHQHFRSGGQSTGTSASGSVLPVKNWNSSYSILNRIDFISEWLVWSACSPKDSQESYPIPQFKKISSLALTLLMVQLSYPYMTTGKTIALTVHTFVSKAMSLLFNVLSRFVICFTGG